MSADIINSQSQIYSKNNPRVTDFVVNYGFTQMNINFGQKLKDKLTEAGITPAELSRRSGVTKQNIGRLLNNTPHPITGALPTTERVTVEKLAKALMWDLDDALGSAGYASGDGSRGQHRGYEKLSPRMKKIADRQIDAIIESLAAMDEQDFDYIDEKEK